MGYLQKITDLCNERGIKLILVRAPIEYGWYEQWDENVQQFADANNLTYINFNDYVSDMGLDLSTDTYDAGIHLNIYGAEKLSDFSVRISRLTTTSRIIVKTPEVSSVYNSKIEFYNAMRDDQLSEIAKYGHLVNYGANAIG